MALEVRNRKVLREAEDLIALGMPKRDVVRKLRRKYRLDWYTADEYVRLARVRFVSDRLTYSDTADLAETASIQYEGWLRRTVKWVGRIVRSIFVPARHPDSRRRA